ncbi:hypothetical protein D3C81_348680 [compost metagenome]
MRLAPCLPGRVEVADQGHRERHQLGNGPFNPAQQPLRQRQWLHRHARTHRAFRHQCQQAITEGTHRAQQQEPEQHREPAPQRVEHGRLDQRRNILAQAATGRLQVAYRRLPGRCIVGIDDRFDIAVQIPRAPAPGQHGHAQQQRWKAEQHPAQQPGDQRHQQQWRYDRQRHAGGPLPGSTTVRVQPAQPAPEAVETAQRRGSGRGDMAKGQCHQHGDQGGEHGRSPYEQAFGVATLPVAAPPSAVNRTVTGSVFRWRQCWRLRTPAAGGTNARSGPAKWRSAVTDGCLHHRPRRHVRGPRRLPRR